MKRNQSPTIFPTVGNSASAGNGEITESAPGGSRIPNLLIRSQMLYPIELRAHTKPH